MRREELGDAGEVFLVGAKTMQQHQRLARAPIEIDDVKARDIRFMPGQTRNRTLAVDRILCELFRDGVIESHHDNGHNQQQT